MSYPDPLPIGVQLDATDEPCTVIETMALGPFVAGTQPWARVRNVSRARRESTLLPPGVEPVRSSHDRGHRRDLGVGPGWTLLVRRWGEGEARLSITAATSALAEEVLDAALAGAIAPAPDENSAVPVQFWHLTRCGPKRSTRSIDIAPWAAIRRNYASPVGAAMDKVMALTPGDLKARLLLLHGPPGTGKTSALRALAHAWRAWCSVECVLDPDRLFGEPGYLLEAAVGDDDSDGERAPDRWRMLLLEDCDELIRSEAKRSAGQSLSRLLNMTDGLLGQGTRVIVAITTNEDLARLHPAVTRPGRCLARVEVGRIPRREAVAWLGHLDGIGPDGATLAELYELRGELGRIERVEDAAVGGQYL